MTSPVITYFLGAVFLWFLREKRIKYFFLLLIPFLAFLQTIFLKPQTTYFIRLFDSPILLFYVDRLNLFFGYIFSLIAFFVILYSFGDKYPLPQKNLHFSLSLFYIGSSLGAIFAGEYLTFFIFLELMAISSTFLIWLGGKHPRTICRGGIYDTQDENKGLINQTPTNREESLNAGFRYLLFHFLAGLCLFAGILIEYVNIYLTTGKFGLSLLTTPTTKLSFVLILLGIGINACFIPLHTWLPDAYPKASFSVSVLLSIYTTKTAVYALARIFPGVNFLAYMGALMSIYGVTFALMQNKMRKLLSYHIVSQVGYMVAAIGLGGDLSINGGLFHALNNILYKTLLFMCAGAVIYKFSEERLTNLGDLFRKMPLTTLSCLIGAFSIAGLPLFNGHISKIIISESAHGNEAIYFLLKIATIGTWLSFLKFTYFGFLRKRELPQTSLRGEAEAISLGLPRSFQSLAMTKAEISEKEVPWSMLIPMVSLALFCFFTGIYPKLVMQILPYPVKELNFYSLKNITNAVQVYLAGLLVFLLLKEYFAPRRVVFLDLDYYYRKVVSFFLHLCRTTIAQFDQGILSALVYFSKKIYYSFLWLCKSVVVQFDQGILSALVYFSKKIFYSFLWLCKKVIMPFDNAYTSSLEKLIPYAKESWMIKKEEGNVEKLIVNGSGLLVKTSERMDYFDRNVIDGAVNRLGKIVLLLAGKLRGIQTGQAQNYALVMFFGLIVLIFFLVVF